jgi:hypothetical protein
VILVLLFSRSDVVVGSGVAVSVGFGGMAIAVSFVGGFGVGGTESWLVVSRPTISRL